ncbi:MAG: hypothetical protein ACRDYY_02290 [Acidimicrobiales bacterium]
MTAFMGGKLVTVSTPGCELCEAAPMTVRHHTDEVCWVADCESCGVPMVVWREHGAEPPPADREHMLRVLETVAGGAFGEGGYWVDPVMRQIPEHFHAHARRRAWRGDGGEQAEGRR